MRLGPLTMAVLTLSIAGPPSAAEDRALEGREAVTTAKERLINKAADPQRVNDCKVPPAKRDGARARPSACPHLQRRDDVPAPDSSG